MAPTYSETAPDGSAPASRRASAVSLLQSASFQLSGSRREKEALLRRKVPEPVRTTAARTAPAARHIAQAAHSRSAAAVVHLPQRAPRQHSSARSELKTATLSYTIALHC